MKHTAAQMTPAQLSRVRAASIAERHYQYVAGIAVQVLIDHIVSLEKQLRDAPCGPACRRDHVHDCRRDHVHD